MPLHGVGMPTPVLDYFEDMTRRNGDTTGQNMMPEIVPDLNQASPFDDGMTWEMVGLGLEEPLPTQEAIDELSVSARSTRHVSC